MPRPRDYIRERPLLKLLAAEREINDIKSVKNKTVKFRKPRVYKGVHGTIDPIKKIEPGFHFGTEKAAKERISFKLFREQFTDEEVSRGIRGSVPGRLLTVQVKDVKRSMGTKRNPLGERELMHITFPKVVKASTASGRDVDPKFRGKADLGQYVNEVEDPGHISKVAFDPSKVKIKDVRTVLPIERPLKRLTKFEGKLRKMSKGMKKFGRKSSKAGLVLGVLEGMRNK